MSAMVAKTPGRPRARGPVELGLEMGFGLLFITLFAWFIGMMIEIVGSFTLWRDLQENHAQQIVEQDLEYIAQAPRSLLVHDTVAWSEQLVRNVRLPYERLGVIAWYERQQAIFQAAQDAPSGDLRHNAARANRSMQILLSRWAVTSMYVLQDVLLRLSVAAFAAPAFILACLVGVVDGLVRRDLRRWGGGRESSFVYHHAKRYTAWALTGGFGLYLAWPFGNFNPSHMVIVFTVLVAFAMSTTVATFKKYV
nr:TIGR03747 family integrating conjugative element membrane protein [Hydrogenophaga sp. NH-16]